MKEGGMEIESGGEGGEGGGVWDITIWMLNIHTVYNAQIYLF
jgi:hypothetical protein